METSLAPNSQAKSRVLTPELSSSISPSEMLCKEDISTSLLTVPSTFGSIQPSSCLMESKQIHPRVLIVDQTSHTLAGVEQTSATDSTLQMGVPPPTQIANTVTFAKTAKRQGMEKISVPNRSYQDLLGSRPKYLRHNLWNPESSFTPTIADWSETAVPLPCPSHLELNDPVAHQTIFEHPSLFKIITPINVNLFECLLSDHPN